MVPLFPLFPLIPFLQMRESHYTQYMNSSEIESFLTENGITFEKFEHPAVFTCEESSKLPPMPGTDTKNLFLRNKRKTRYFLVSIGHDKQADLKALSDLLGAGRLSFGSADDLMELLGVEPGSVTILGLINDTEKRIDFHIDSPLWEADALRVHPLRNTASLIVPHDGIEKFLELSHHEATITDVPGFL